jgi:uncharacterized protein (TIGR03435 family)
MFLAPLGIAQQAAPSERPSFSVTSIKPSDPDARGQMFRMQPGGGFSASAMTLRFLIKFAYDLRDDQITGGPNWLDSKRYDVDAKSDPPFGGDPRNMKDDERKEYFRQIGLRLQSMLADRFQLKISHSTKEMPVYYLVVAKGGPKLKEGQSPGPMFRMSPNQLDVTGGDMESLTHVLSDLTGRTVLDKTGLTGHYDFKLEFTPDSSLAFRGPGPGPGGPGGAPGGPQPPPSELAGPTLLTALQEQLGLKLESHKGPADIVNIDSAQFPSEN